MNIIPVFGAFSLVCWILFLFCFHKDRSRYRNCYLLFAALLSLIPLIVILSHSISRNLLVFLGMGATLAVLTVPFFLICNGIVMIRREGRHPAQLMSLALGIAMFAGEAIVSAGILRYSGPNQTQPFIPRTFLGFSAAVLAVTVIYGSVSFLVFMIYTLFLQIIPRKKDFDFVIIHGAGLLDGSRVSKLLKDRLDKAIEVYRQDPTPPRLIPSGGQGRDETISEAEAMAQYLISQGIPPDHILPENQSASTMENLMFSKDILDRFEGRKYTALVSSNYHIYRALRYCREIGLKCTGIGSHVAFYYWPSALIREYIAIHAERKHAVIFLLGWLLCIALLVWSVFR